MQTTIRVAADVARILEDVKSREHLKSYNEVIRLLLEKREISMFGADKKLRRWKESEDRAQFR